jgi:hypothetical protein
MIVEDRRPLVAFLRKSLRTPVIQDGSGRNSVVHSLSVTLSNHTILGNTSYNDPCPKDHPSYDRQTMAGRMANPSVNLLTEMFSGGK